ncbi:U3 snoRNP protein [Rhizophlyctis rosea]|uniref:U3 small nucleolar RNA-associated protein 18 homolog n=1 Tax=Rhizophlyctis rosea TaxID=64517 RepID=A0AAD5X3J6_9FUNG|nr:U3 snoRNP protein [Rhizophlyctis rosea]
MIDLPNLDLKGRLPKSKKRKAPDAEPPAKQPAAVPSDTPAKKKKRRNKKKKSDEAPTMALPKDRGINDIELVELEEKDDEELALEDAVFGGGEDRIRRVLDKAGREFERADRNNDSEVNGDDGDLFAIDTKGSGKREVESENEEEDDVDFGFVIDKSGQRDSDDEEASDQEAEEEPQAAPPAWEDEDDIAVNIANTRRLRKLRKDYAEEILTGRDYEERLRAQFEKLHPTPEWANQRSQEDEEIGGDLLTILRRTKGIVKTGRAKPLNPDRLEVVRMKDANQMAYSQGAIQSLSFHPTAPVLLTASLDKSLKLFQIDGRINPKIQSLILKDLPITSATFAHTGTQIYLSGKRPYFYSFDIETGKIDKIPGLKGREERNLEKHVASPCGRFVVFKGSYGSLLIVSTISRQLVGELKMNGPVRDLCFSGDGRWLFGFSDGEVYQWDMDTRQCVHRFTDEGCVGARTISVGDGYIATGSSAGIVNLYSTATALSSPTPTPSKVIQNLTTSISNLTFSPDSKILALSSREKKDSLRLFHTESGRVFKNWPTAQTPLGYVNGVAFSPGGGYVGIGNDKGKVLLYRLGAYDAN